MRSFFTGCIFTGLLLIANSARAETHIGRWEVTASEDVGHAVSTYAPDTPKLNVFLEILDSKAGDKVNIAWVATNATGAPPGYVIADNPIEITQDGMSGGHGSLSKPTNGWPIGQYKVNISINGTFAKSADFTVK